MLPKKINPDYIRNSLVHVYYWSAIPNIPSIGYIYSYLNSLGYVYIDNDSEKEHLYVNEETKVKVQYSSFKDRKTLSFNCTENYLGWESYSHQINTVIQTLFENNVITKIHGVMLHYISTCDENIFDNLNLNFSAGDLEESNHTFIRKDEDYEVQIQFDILTQDKAMYSLGVTVNNKQEKEIIAFSEFNELLNNAHTKEKETFFSLISNESLKKLNPEY